MSFLATPFRARAFTFVLAFVALAAAASSSRAQTIKVGVFDRQRIVDESKMGLAAKARFEKLQSDKEGELSGKQKSVEDLQAQLNQKGSVLSEDKKRDLAQQVARSRDDLQAAATNADRDLQRAYNLALEDLVKKIDGVLGDFAKEQSFDLLLDKDQCAFARSTLDVTDALMAKVNSVYPGQ